MPRIYKSTATKRYKKPDPVVLAHALETLKEPGSTYSSIADACQIDKSVIYRHNKNCKKQGGQSWLDDDFESVLVSRLLVCADWGYPVDILDLRLLVKAYFDQKGVKHTKFKNNMPGIDWTKSFMKRQRQELSERLCQN